MTYRVTWHHRMVARARGCGRVTRWRKTNAIQMRNIRYLNESKRYYKDWVSILTCRYIRKRYFGDRYMCDLTVLCSGHNLPLTPLKHLGVTSLQDRFIISRQSMMLKFRHNSCIWILSSFHCINKAVKYASSVVYLKCSYNIHIHWLNEASSIGWQEHYFYMWGDVIQVFWVAWCIVHQKQYFKVRIFLPAVFFPLRNCVKD